jgi:hypothetical protein
MTYPSVACIEKRKYISKQTLSREFNSFVNCTMKNTCGTFSHHTTFLYKKIKNKHAAQNKRELAISFLP